MKRYLLSIVVLSCAVTYAYRDLETGTFLTRDPIGYEDGPNVYCYVHCNPITFFDAWGLEMKKYTDTAPVSELDADTFAARVTRSGLDQRTVGFIDPEYTSMHTFMEPLNRSPYATKSAYKFTFSGGLKMKIVMKEGWVGNADAIDHERKHESDIGANYNLMYQSLNKLDGFVLRDDLSDSDRSRFATAFNRLFKQTDKTFKKWNAKEKDLYHEYYYSKDKKGGMTEEEYNEKYQKLQEQKQEDLDRLDSMREKIEEEYGQDTEKEDS